MSGFLNSLICQHFRGWHSFCIYVNPTTRGRGIALGECVIVSLFDERAARIVPVLVFAAIVVGACGLRLMPHGMLTGVLNLLTAWFLLSVPIGVMAGHCIQE